MGLLNDILAAVDNRKRVVARNIWDAIQNPGDFANMTAARMQEDRYGSPEGAQAMKQYLSRQPYDANALAGANEALTRNMIDQGASALGIFVGKNSKNADIAKMLEAQKLLDSGVDRAKVWQQTGWGKAPDGQMKFEIDDSKAAFEKSHPVSWMTEMNPMGKAKTAEEATAMGKEYNDHLKMIRDFKAADGKLGNAYLHNELYQADPGAYGLRLEFKNIGSPFGASYGNGRIEMGMANLGNETKAKEALTHELQHHVQEQYPEWAKGGSPEEMISFLKQNPQYGNDPKDAYNRLYGEAEARLAANRMKLNAHERLQQYPWDEMSFHGSTGVPIEDLIFKYK